jgi:hypothetical protein
MTFEVASVKVSNPDTRPRQNLPLDPTDSFQDVRTREWPNGRFSAVSGLSTYIRFAYKLRLTSITQPEAYAGTEKAYRQANKVQKPQFDAAMAAARKENSTAWFAKVCCARWEA